MLSKNKYNRKLVEFNMDEKNKDIWEENWTIDEHGDLIFADDASVNIMKL